MAISQIGLYRNASLRFSRLRAGTASLGLTLIEVLIALAIIAIAMTAVIKAGSQNIRSTTHLQTKTLATWAAQQALNEARAGVVGFQNSDSTIKRTSVIFGQSWYVEMKESETPNKRIHKVEANVYEQKEYNDDTSPVVTLVSYLYGAQP